MNTILILANIALLIIWIIAAWRKSETYKKMIKLDRDIFAENSLKNSEALIKVVEQTVAIKKQNQLLLEAIEKGLYVTSPKNSNPLD